MFLGRKLFCSSVLENVIRTPGVYAFNCHASSITGSYRNKNSHKENITTHTCTHQCSFLTKARSHQLCKTKVDFVSFTGSLECQNISLGLAKRNIQTSSKLHKEGSLMLWESVKELKSSPVPALTLGLSGLLPFMAVPGYMICSQVYMPYLATVQLFYGATILSFLGGVRWGLTLTENGITKPNWFNLIYSVIPPLVAWTGLMLPLPYSILTMVAGLAGVGYYDIMLYGYPAWFKGLRFVLTFIAILSLWSTFMCSLMLKSLNDNKEMEKEEN